MAKKIFSAFLAVVLMVSLLFGGVPMVSAANKSNKTIKITKQPVSVTVSKGSTAKVALTASGYKLSYKWYVKNKGKSKYTLAKSYKKNYYSAKMSKSVNGRKVYCVITNKYGKKVKSNTVTLNMGKTLKIKKHPASVKMASGGTAKLNITASGEKLTYKWYYKDKNKSKFTLAKSFKKNTYSVKMSKGLAGRQVYCVVKDKYGSTVTSKTATLNLGKSITISTQPKSVKVKKGTVAKVSVKATGDKLKYKWYYKDAGKTKYTLATAFKSNYYSVNMGDNVNGRKVYCLITDTYGLTKKTNAVTLSMGKTLKITKQPTSVVAFKNAAAKVSVAAYGDGVKYTWYYKDTKASSWTKDKSTKNYYSATMTSSVNGRKVYCVVTDAYGSSVVSNTVILTMAAELVVKTQPKNEIVYYGSQTNISVVASGEGLTYTWYCKKQNESFQVDSDNKTNRYIKTVDYSLNNAQVYCKITDKYGVVVKTDTVTIKGAQRLGITSHLEDAIAHCKEKFNLEAGVNGEELKFEWYCKKADEENFNVVDGFDSCTFIPNATEELNGAKVYCKVTDILNNSVSTNTVTLTVQHNFDEGNETKAPTCQEEGAMLFSCSDCTHSYTEAIEKSGHDWTEEWTISKEPTPYEMGEKYKSCQTLGCEEKDIVQVDKLSEKDAVYSIFVYETVEDYNQNNKKATVLVCENGAYNLRPLSRDGYILKGWKGANTEDFAASGKVTGNVSVYAVWDVDGTDTAEKLVARVNAGVEDIKITNNIVVSEPLYITKRTTVYSDGDYSIARASDYNGDIFVVGQDAEGNFTVIEDPEAKATLNLGGGEGTLTIDGNRDSTTVDVVGTLVFAADSSLVNINDGVVLANNNKVGNKRTNDLDYDEYNSETVLSRIGGAAIINLNSTVNMNGGEIKNNAVETEHTIVEGSKKEYNGCGGAIYNLGNFNMYGGTITNNEALRGGAIYNNSVVYIYEGIISNNKSYTYGGAISSSSAKTADMFIGTKDGDGIAQFIGNTSTSAGGALYSSTLSPIIIYGNTEFKDNRSETSGGAIYTAGTLTVSDTKFSGNSSKSSGGAVYHFYSSADYTNRIFDVLNCEFVGNESSLGGAVILSASTDVSELGKGTEAYFNNCTFTDNNAIPNSSYSGDGGAIYVTRNSDLVLNKSTFEDNFANNNAGALYVKSEAKVDIDESYFEGNTAINGGGIYSTSEATVNITNTDFTSNATIETEPDEKGKTKVGSGGAVYLYNATVTISKVGMYNNSSSKNAGAFYIGGKDVTIDSTCEFIGNTAAEHGGAIYVTYQTVENEETESTEKIGSKVDITDVMFENNTALYGGAISARTNSNITLDGAQFIGNSTPNAKISEDHGGGAIFINNSDLDIKEVSFTDNISGYYGGCIKANSCNINITDTSFEGAKGATGAVMYATGCTLNADTVNVTKGKSTGNGMFYLTKSTATFEKLTATENDGKYGIVNANFTATVTITESDIRNNETSQGGAIYANDRSVVNLNNTEISNNTASSEGGAAYLINATLNVDSDTVISGNTAKTGGAIYGENNATINIDGAEIKNNSANNAGAIMAKGVVLRLRGGALFQQNTTKALGGALYIIKHTETKNEVTTTVDSDVLIDGVSFIENTADSHGGAIYIKNVTVNATGNNLFDGNSAKEHGGAIYVTYGTVGEEKIGGVVNMANGTFTNNTALAGGAVSLRSACQATFNGTTFTNNYVEGNDGKLDGNAEGGGAIYVGYGELNLNDVTATKNESALFGGVVDGVDSIINVVGGSYSDNQSADGGVFYNIEDTVLNIEGAEFKNNASTFDNTDLISSVGGGAINMFGGELSIKSTTFDGNTTDSYGGAVMTNKTAVSISDNSVFTNSIGSTGSALNIKYGSASISNTDFSSNNANRNGVVYLSGGTYLLDSVTINNNTSKSGAIYTSATATTVNINDSTISENNVTDGGALYVSNATVNLTDTELSNNTATTNGGTIYSANGKITVVGSTLSENSAKHGGSIYSEKGSVTIGAQTLINGNTATNGGALYLQGTVLKTSDNALFKENSATSNGGAIYVKNLSVTENEVTTTTESQLEIVDSKFEANTAKLGGAIYNYNSPINVLSGSTFLKNESTTHGGAIYIVYATVTATGNNVFDSNVAAGHGGAIYVTYETVNEEKFGGVVNMTNGTFTNNTALAGGAVSLRSACQATFNGTTFTENSVSGADEKDNEGNDKADGNADGGGAIYVGWGTLNLNNATVTGNTSQYFGGAIDSAKSTINVVGGSYCDNQAGNGGVFYNITNTELSIEGAEFKNNKSTDTTSDNKYGGGAINMNKGELSIKSSTFDGNETAYYGGALLIHGATTTIAEDTVFTNSVGKTGSALGFVSVPSLTIKDTEVTKTVGNGNGVIYISGGTVNIKNLTASENSSSKGGVFYLSGGVTLTVEDSTLTKNTITSTGGVIDNRSSKAVSFINSTISENTAANGGFMYDVGVGEVTISGCTINDNVATANGGAIYATIASDTSTKSSKITVSESTKFNNNTAVKGGAVFLDEGAEFNVTASEFDGNQATADGGAILIDDATNDDAFNTTLNANGVTFKNNTVVGKGGAICTETGCPNIVINVENCTFDKNSSTDANGGAVFIQNGNQPDATDPEKINIVFTDCVFTGNTAKTSGGAVEIRTASVAKFDGITANDNIAKTNGGVIYVTSDYSRVYLTGEVSISNNTAKVGDFVYLYYKSTYNASPKMYTTHSSTESWVNYAGSNDTSVNIEFDLTELP